VIKAVVLLLLLLSSRSFAGTISVVGPLINPGVGTIFDVDIDVTGVTDLYAFQFDLSFNPAILSGDSVIEGTFLPSGGTTFFIPGAIDNVGGTITANADTLIGAIPGVTGDGTLAVFQFTALAPGTSPLSFANEILLDSSLNDITASTTSQNGSVTISGISSIPEPQTLTLLVTGLLVLVTVCRLHRKDKFSRGTVRPLR
jgi:hypothetical protein